jgi:hypothetical protein
MLQLSRVSLYLSSCFPFALRTLSCASAHRVCLTLSKTISSRRAHERASVETKFVRRRRTLLKTVTPLAAESVVFEISHSVSSALDASEALEQLQ